MMMYLVKMTDRQTSKTIYKIGHTKWGPSNIMKRFDDPEYADFKITLLSYMMFSHGNWAVAKAVIITAENMIRAVIPPKPPSFMIEEYFERPAGSMKISGVTELFLLKETQTEDMLVSVFDRFKPALQKTHMELTEHANS